MRSHYCGQVTETLLEQEVTLCGWENRRRDHGGVIFIDLRECFQHAHAGAAHVLAALGGAVGNGDGIAQEGRGLGLSIEQAQAGLLLALGRLTPQDRFNLIRFDSDM